VPTVRRKRFRENRWEVILRQAPSITPILVRPTVTYDRWFDQAHGKLRAEHAWVKLHVMVGTVTNVVTSVEVSSAADCPLLPVLLGNVGFGRTPTPTP
jgi:hypothetical protein